MSESFQDQATHDDDVEIDESVEWGEDGEAPTPIPTPEDAAPVDESEDA